MAAGPGKSPKTVRFASVVDRCGQPKVHVSWIAQDKDTELQRALKQDRVLTLAPRPGGGKAERGYVGFDAANAAGAQILIFPKPLKAFAGVDVIGVKFELVDQPDLAPATPEPKAKKKPARKQSTAVTPPAKILAEADNREPSRKTHSQASPRPVARLASPPQPPAPEKVESTQRKTSAVAAEASPPRFTASRHTALVIQIRKALDELQDGKAVAAYKRLERAVADER